MQVRCHCRGSPALLGFASIKCIECKQNPTELAAQCCFIAAQAIECKIGRIGETQEAAGELDSRTSRLQIALSTAVVAPLDDFVVQCGNGEGTLSCIRQARYQTQLPRFEPSHWQRFRAVRYPASPKKINIA